MKNFVKYTADGTVYRFNKNGEGVCILRHVHCDGVARLDQNFAGAIHRQNPDLLPCHAISISYYEL